MINRLLTQTVLNHLSSGFISLIYGPRRVGKTVLLEQIRGALDEKSITFNGDTEEGRTALSSLSEVKLSEMVKNHAVIFVDEAQRIKNIALSLKIIIDKFPGKKIFVTGSSSLELSRGATETLTGRVKIYKLFPLSFIEKTIDLEVHQKPFALSDFLLYGGYPYLLQLDAPAKKQEYLKNIIESYLFKDVLLLERLENPENLTKLATLLAFQIGAEVSLNELSRTLLVDVKTVARYLNLLKQSFIIFELGSFSNNLRQEISKSKKYYFHDLGIRNALINQFSGLELRNDLGALWENFLCLERLKKHEYARQSVSTFFWRNYQNAEIDWIEKTEQEISAFEFKWNKQTAKWPKQFVENYPGQKKVISKENFLEFI